LFVSPRFSCRISPTSGIRADGSLLSPSGWAQFDPISKVFLTEVSGKHVPYKCVNISTSKGLVASKERLSLEGEIVRYSSVSLSPTLDRNEKVQQHIRKKIHKPQCLKVLG